MFGYTIAGFNEIDGGPYPAFSRGPIHALSNTTTLVRGRHTFKAGVVVEYSGEDDFDQINVLPLERHRAAPRRGVLDRDKTIVRASGGIFHNRATLNDSTIFNFPNHPNLGGNPGGQLGLQTNQLSGNLGYVDPSSATFGRITRKTDDRRDIQLSLRFQF